MNSVNAAGEELQRYFSVINIGAAADKNYATLGVIAKDIFMKKGKFREKALHIRGKSYWINQLLAPDDQLKPSCPRYAINL